MSKTPLISVAICDDLEASLKHTSELTEELLASVSHVIHPFSDSDSLLQSLKDRTYTLAILDIRMPEDQPDGIELARQLLMHQPDCRIIFLTAFASYAQDVYDVEHVAFVLKKDIRKNLARAIDRLLLSQRSDAAPRIPVDSEGVIHMIRPEQVVYIERNLRKTQIHLAASDEKPAYVLETREKTEDIISRLNAVLCAHGYASDCFIQSHKSYAAHWKYVERYEKDRLILDEQTSIPISRRYADQVRRSFLAWSV